MVKMHVCFCRASHGQRAAKKWLMKDRKGLLFSIQEFAMILTLILGNGFVFTLHGMIHVFVLHYCIEYKNTTRQFTWFD